MVEIKALDKTYKGLGGNSVHAVNNVTLSLPDSGIVAIFGKSGCGKTTLLNVIGGLDSADAGTVELDGARISPSANEERNFSVGYIFQNYNLSKNMTVFENVASALRLCGTTDEEEIAERVGAALAEVEMEKYSGRMPEALSGGQQQRVAIARALVKRPKLILADEPTGNLDEHNTVLVMDILREIARDCLVVLVTHEADLVDLYCDRVIEVVDGCIVGDRQNAATGGFEGRGANDVYLGDMPRSELSDGAVSVELFGKSESFGPKLRLISRGGTLYVEAQGLKIKPLDRESELRVHEGRFEERAKRSVKELSPVLRKSPSLGKAGRMYDFKSAVKSGYRNNFGKARLGKKAIFVGLITFAVIVVLLVSSFGTIFHKMDVLMENFNSNTVFVDRDLISLSEVQELLASGEADHATSLFLSVDMPPRAISEYEFDIGTFESFASVEASNFAAKGTPVPISAMGNAKLLCGKAELQDDAEFLITSALADKLLANVAVSYITSYEDILDLACTIKTNNGNHNGDFTVIYPESRLVGVVEGDELAAYHSVHAVAKADLAAVTTKPEYFEVYSRSSLGLAAIENGSVYLSEREFDSKYLESGIDINGMHFNVVGFFDPIDERLDGLNAFIKAQGTLETPADLATNFGSYLYYYYHIYDAEDLKSSDLDRYNAIYGEWLMQCERWSAKYYDTIYSVCERVYMTLEDMQMLAYSAGDTDANFLRTFNGISLGARIRYCGLHSSAINELEQKLEEHYGVDGVYTTADFYNYYSADYKEEFVRLTVSLVVIFAVMALSLYFIMRSALFADIKDVGIARAIGVSRKNLVFRYFIETLVVFALTVFVGYGLTSLVLALLMGASSYLYDYLYYPLYLALPTFALVLVINVVCGILPILLLLKKTPANILSKYDI